MSGSGKSTSRRALPEPRHCRLTIRALTILAPQILTLSPPVLNSTFSFTFWLPGKRVLNEKARGEDYLRDQPRPRLRAERESGAI